MRVFIETIMETIEQVYDAGYDLTITGLGECHIICVDGKLVNKFSSLPELYRWIAEQEEKLAEQQKAINDQRAKDHRDSEPTKHRF